jgi:hypothetical protein
LLPNLCVVECRRRCQAVVVCGPIIGGHVIAGRGVDAATWLPDRRCMPYCFRCLVLNDADVSAPRWKREWLDPTAEFCSVHHRPLETVPASVLRLSKHFDVALRAISRYREKCLFRATGRLR